MLLFEDRLNKKGSKDSLYLGLFVIAYSLDFIPPLINHLGISANNPRLYYIPLQVSDFLFPLLYLYAHATSVLSHEKKNLHYFFPAVISNAIFLFIFLLPDAAIDHFNRHFNWLIGIKLGSQFYSNAVGIITIRMINKHIKSLGDQYSNTTYRDLKWLKQFIIFGVIFSLTVPVINLFTANKYYSLFVSTINTVLLYWVSLKGIMQKTVKFLLVPAPSEAPDTYEQENIKEEQQVEDNSLDIEINIEIIHAIENLLTNEKISRKKDLTIMDLSQSLHLHPKYVSKIVNSYYKQNFNTLINSFRVAEAKVLLIDAASKEFSIEGIGHIVGFKSKTSFYAAFKKQEGITPTQFKEKTICNKNEDTPSS